MDLASASSDLAAARILVVEDVHFVADDLCRALQQVNAEVVGPVASVREALALLEGREIDAAVLDVNLAGEMSFPIAQRLLERRVPFLFASGYDDWAMPGEWQHVPRVNKPYDLQKVITTLASLIDKEATS